MVLHVVIRQEAMMKPTPIYRSAPAWLLELAMARSDYEELLGWPVELQITARRLTIPAGRSFDAVFIPVRLGAPVQRQLRVVSQDGPVIAGPRRGWLTFLTKLSASAEPLLPTDLDHAGVSLVRRGKPVVLPAAPEISDAGEVRWFSPPRPRRMPAWPVVLGVCRRVISGLDFGQTPSGLRKQQAA